MTGFLEGLGSQAGGLGILAIIFGVFFGIYKWRGVKLDRLRRDNTGYQARDRIHQAEEVVDQQADQMRQEEDPEKLADEFNRRP